MVGKTRRKQKHRQGKDRRLPLTKDGKVDWAKVPDKVRDRMFSALVPLEHFLNGKIHWLISIGSTSAKMLDRIRAELINDLAPITDSFDVGSKRFKTSERKAAAKRMAAHLEYLCEKITSLEGLRPIFEVESEELRVNRRLQSRGQGIFSWGIGDWVIGMSFTFDSPSGWRSIDPRRDLYAYIATGLISGELARLRRCGYCRKFIIADQPRMTFCPGHARLYYDRPSQRRALPVA